VQPLLPYIEQDNLYRIYDASRQTNGNWALLCPNKDTLIPALVCPTDPSSPKTQTRDTNSVNGANVMQGLHTNYVLCAGSTSYGTTGRNLNGSFYVKSATRITDVTDGTSNTAFASEICVSPDVSANDLRGRYCNTWEGNNLFSTLNPPNTTVPDRQTYQGQSITWAPITTIGNDGSQELSARSRHDQGVNALMGDGSVRFVSNSVNAGTWQGLGSRSGGEVNTNF